MRPAVDTAPRITDRNGALRAAHLARDVTGTQCEDRVTYR